MMLWPKYYVEFQRVKACSGYGPKESIEYGEEIYSSLELNDVRWLVVHFRNEYNVFVDRKIAPDRYDRNFGASFATKDQALRFALEMFLVCCGKLRRANRYNLARLCEERGY